MALARFAQKVFSDKTIGLLKRYYAQQKGIHLAFVFGSIATGSLRTDSDVDVAVLFETVPDPFELSLLAGELSSLIGREVDLVALNEASPILKMQVLRFGKLLYQSEPRRFHEFYVRTVNEYDDLKQMRKKAEQSILLGRIHA